MTPSDESLERALRALRAEYLAASPLRIAELWTEVERVQNGDIRGIADLQVLVHRLAGSGGGYGLPDVTAAARAADAFCRELIERGAPLRPSDMLRLREHVQGIVDAFARAQLPE